MTAKQIPLDGPLSTWKIKQYMLPRLNFLHKRLMPAKINITSHISLHTWPRRTKFFHIPDGRETILATGHQDDNKNTYEANILCSLTFEVFQKHTFFRIKHLRPPSPKRPVADTARRRNGGAELS